MNTNDSDRQQTAHNLVTGQQSQTERAGDGTLGSTDSPAGDQDPAALKAKASEDLQEIKGRTKDKAGEIADRAKSEARSQANAGIDRAADEVDQLSDVLEAAASSLSEQDKEGLADYAQQFAEGMSNLSTNLRERSLDELTEDARSLARNNPTAFLIGSVTLGFGLSRFLKASEQREPGSHEDRLTNQPGYSASYARPASGTANVTARRTTPGASLRSSTGESATVTTTDSELERSPL